MIFARIGMATAWFLFILGCATAGAGIYFAASGMGHGAAQEYFNRATTGELVDKGLFNAAIGLAIGIVSEIALKLGGMQKDV
ncbi:MAG: hypothetical protein AB3N23_16860 [Paracoccaceae bacterium]